MANPWREFIATWGRYVSRSPGQLGGTAGVPIVTIQLVLAEAWNL